MDITTAWNNVTGQGADWQISSGDLQSGSDLETAVLLCLFTDARLPDDLQVADGTNDRRGWWGSTYTPYPIGSLLWTLDRAKIGNSTTLLLQARDYCTAALQPLIRLGVVRTVKVSTSWLASNALGIIVGVSQPTQGVTTFNYSYTWGSVSSLPQA